MAEGGHVDDPATALRPNLFEQQVGQQEVPQVVRAEHHLEALCGLVAFVADQPCVVQQHVDGVEVLQRLREVADRGQVRQVQAAVLDSVVAGAGPQFCDRGVRPFGVAASEHHTRSL